MKNIILIAPPFAGKGTISSYLIENYKYTHISTGDILRNIIDSGSEKGLYIASLIDKGLFVPDECILPLFKEELIKVLDKPFILDGVPRNINQAKYLNDLFLELNISNYQVIYIDIEKDILEKRVTGRRVCDCGESYNIYFEDFKPLKENICNKCGKMLKSRKDDTLETFKERYKTFIEETYPLKDYYQEQNVLETLDGNSDILTLKKELKKIIGA